MRNAPPFLMVILLYLVQSIQMKFQHVVCEEKYHVTWCLNSVTCVNEFLNCKCVPRAAFVTPDKYPDTLSLCMFAYAYGVSEPKCCISDRKRDEMPRVSNDDLRSTDDAIISLILGKLQKRNGDEYSDVSDNFRPPSLPNIRTNSHTDTENKYSLIKSGLANIPDTSIVSKSFIPGTDSGFYSFLEKLIANSNNERINLDDILESALLNDANSHLKHKSTIKRTNSKSRHKSRIIRSENAIQNFESWKRR